MTGATDADPRDTDPPVRGVRIGVDVGTVRIGVAVSDPDGVLATPLATVQRDPTACDAGTGTQKSGNQKSGNEEPSDSQARLPSDVVEIARLVREHHAVEVIVGLPLTLAGREALAARDARRYGELLATAISPIPVKLTDERMSTAVAGRRLSERGVRGRRRRAVVDQAAAVEILQGWLDARRRQRDA